MQNINYWLIKQAHIVWIASIVNIGLGVIIPDFDFFAKSISYVALEAPLYAYTHRTANIIIGLSMCGFAFGIYRTSQSRISSASLSCFLFGISMISAGIWTLETPLHLLYNLSIFMIILPIAFSLEFKNIIKSQSFENVCVGVTVLHVLMFWLIYAGFIPQDYNGLIQRVWAIPTMGWFGVAAYMLSSRRISANNAMHATSA
ncbi:MAG: DUF998 domain-containing protein [Pseudoalteromonas prydzensis]|uniref:DUF998 domain-containing protein n=1 Tax=Pseudoalteromonas prydzensis TaxID=182141 RepID=UPI003F96BF04